MVVKKDGRREEFTVEKLRGGLVKACNKRSISTDTINRLLFDVEQILRAEPGSEVDVARIGEIVMEKLFELDEVAYVRFASVYQRFDDVKRFAQIIERISRRSRQVGGAINEKEGGGTGTVVDTIIARNVPQQKIQLPANEPKTEL
jgi:transcriptional repressor NrdR